ncbi:hypothetical protein CEXT_682871 [Caerostris extrusa]|uniref:Uncharacterized protein n=1 Tax=Caerostris extrusa TaxID=172846 RepID=A0AAV4XAA5_CAEEX|nr:hypothetical protein CEXT_682871 [Caerostris extrusa]
MSQNSNKTKFGFIQLETTFLVYSECTSLYSPALDLNGTQKVRRQRRDSDHDDSLRTILSEDGITAGTTPATYLTPGGSFTMPFLNSSKWGFFALGSFTMPSRRIWGTIESVSEFNGSSIWAIWKLYFIIVDQEYVICAMLGAIIGGEFFDVKNGSALITDEPTDVVELEKMIDDSTGRRERDVGNVGKVLHELILEEDDHSEDNLKKRIVEIETLQTNKNM